MNRDSITGCIFGTAVGDALGLPYENRKDCNLLPSWKLCWQFRRGFKRGTWRMPPFSICLPEKINEIRLSDNNSFWDQGYPALLLTDTSHEHRLHRRRLHRIRFKSRRQHRRNSWPAPPPINPKTRRPTQSRRTNFLSDAFNRLLKRKA